MPETKAAFSLPMLLLRSIHTGLSNVPPRAIVVISVLVQAALPISPNVYRPQPCRLNFGMADDPSFRKRTEATRTLLASAFRRGRHSTMPRD
jgi:hypothetical protein